MTARSREQTQPTESTEKVESGIELGACWQKAGLLITLPTRLHALTWKNNRT